MWEQLLKAQIESALQRIVAHDSLICSGENYTAEIGTLIGTKGQDLVQDQLCFVFNLVSGSTILVEGCLLDLSFHDLLVFFLTFRD